MNNLQITSRIKLLCKEKNISVAQLLSDCGFAKSFVYDLEKRDNSPSCDRISKIADSLDCSVDYLLGRTDKPEKIAEAYIAGDNNGVNMIKNSSIQIDSTKVTEDINELLGLIYKLPLVKRAEAIIYLNNLKNENTNHD